MIIVSLDTKLLNKVLHLDFREKATSLGKHATIFVSFFFILKIFPFQLITWLIQSIYPF